MVEGCVNFREVERFSTRDGGRLRAGRLFRSGAYHEVTASGIEQVRALGPQLVYDLRSRAERTRMPTRLDTLGGLNLRPEPHDITLGSPLRALREAGTTPEQGRAAMRNMYGILPFGFAPVLQDFMHRAAETQGLTIVHCQIGKDRTGAAVALLLSALGVDRDSVTEDYVRTNAAAPAIRAQLRARSGDGSYETYADPVLETIIAAAPEYLAAFFDAIEEAEGSVDAYLANRLELDTATLDRLRANFLS